MSKSFHYATVFDDQLSQDFGEILGVATAIRIDPITGDDYITAAEYAAVTISGTTSGIADAETLTLAATDGTNNWAGTATVSGNAWTATPVIDMTGWNDGNITVTVELDSDPTVNRIRTATLDAVLDAVALFGDGLEKALFGSSLDAAQFGA